MTTTKNIAIIAWGAMADVLYATPIVKHIRQLHPNDVIVWMVRDKFAPVVEGNPDITYVKKFTLPEGYNSRQDAEYKMDQQILEHADYNFDVVYDLQYWPRYANFYERPNEDFISLRARNAGLDPQLIRDRSVVLPVVDDNEVEEFYLAHLDGLGSFITVNHISYAASAVWSFENYQSLVKILRQNDIWSVFTGASNEPIPEGAIDARGMPYVQWAGLIQMSDLWLGLDSGAVALACATDTPIVKLHSPDFPIRKTGIKAMGLRDKNVLELCPAPSPESLAQIIMENMKQ